MRWRRTAIAFAAALVALSAVPFVVVAAPRQQNSPQPASITFLTAACPADSPMAVAVAGGSDPAAADNGSDAAVPADIGAYGCREAQAGYHLYLLTGSTARATYLDPGLATLATISANDGGWDGVSSAIGPGDAFFVEADRPARRRFSVAEFEYRGNSWAGPPFLDLQCYTDGADNNNGDGVGWNNQALAAGTQAYCIFYFLEGSGSAATPTEGTSSPTATPVPVDGASLEGAVVKELHPDVAVDEANGVVTWIIRPATRGQLLYLWDANAGSCRAFGGADCGGIAGDGSPGRFRANPGQSQLLVVTQSFDPGDGQCNVENTVEWSGAPDTAPGDRYSATAVYRCSGANALGWPLLGLAVVAAVGVAWVVHRRAGWPG